MKTKITAQMVNKILRRQAGYQETAEGQMWMTALCLATVECTYARYKAGCMAFFSSDHFDKICYLLRLDTDYVRGMIGKIGDEVELEQDSNGNWTLRA